MLAISVREAIRDAVAAFGEGEVVTLRARRRRSRCFCGTPSPYGARGAR